MTTALSPLVASRLEKGAVDNGFDQELPCDGDSLGFTSTQGAGAGELARYPAQ